MDLVEAMDAWIDELIDELSDDELARILDILDVVAVSPFAQRDPDDLSSGELVAIAELAGRSRPARAQAEVVLRAALFDEEIDLDDVFSSRYDDPFDPSTPRSGRGAPTFVVPGVDDGPGDTHAPDESSAETDDLDGAAPEADEREQDLPFEDGLPFADHGADDEPAPADDEEPANGHLTFTDDHEHPIADLDPDDDEPAPAELTLDEHDPDDEPTPDELNDHEHAIADLEPDDDEPAAADDELADEHDPDGEPTPDELNDPAGRDLDDDEAGPDDLTFDGHDNEGKATDVDEATDEPADPDDLTNDGHDNEDSLVLDDDLEDDLEDDEALADRLVLDEDHDTDDRDADEPVADERVGEIDESSFLTDLALAQRTDEHRAIDPDPRNPDPRNPDPRDPDRRDPDRRDPDTPDIDPLSTETVAADALDADAFDDTPIDEQAEIETSVIAIIGSDDTAADIVASTTGRSGGRLEPKTWADDPLLGPGWTQLSVAEVPLRPHDDLGPAFLPETPEATVGTRIRHILLPVIMLAAMAAFVLGMMQLLDSLDEPSEVASVEPDVDGLAAASADDSADSDGDEDAEPAATAAPAADAQQEQAAPGTDEAADQPAAPPPPAALALRLATGSVVVESDAAGADAGSPVVVTEVYAPVDEERAPAVDISWGAAGLAVVDEAGNVALADPTGAREPIELYSSSEELGAAVQVGWLPELIVARTDLGNIVVLPPGADPSESPVVVWDGAERGLAAVDLTTSDGFVPFALDNGDARMAAAGSGADWSGQVDVLSLWIADETQPSVEHLVGIPNGVLLGLADGSVVLYRLGDVDGARTETVWTTPDDPATVLDFTAEQDHQTVIVRADGAVVYADAGPQQAPLWDPSETETRARSAIVRDRRLTMLLETGSVLRLSLGEDGTTEGPIESLWDITDETLAHAEQIALEPAAN